VVTAVDRVLGFGRALNVPQAAGSQWSARSCAPTATTAWSPAANGVGVVSHAGAASPQEQADQLGLTRQLAGAAHRATFPVGDHPAEDGGAGHSQRLGDGIWAGALLNLLDRADAKLLKGDIVEQYDLWIGDVSA
jgi:hypothetical protein